jgi:phosphoserine phosphatase
MRLPRSLVISATPESTEGLQRALEGARLVLEANSALEHRWLSNGGVQQILFTIEDGGDLRGLHQRILSAIGDSHRGIDINVVAGDLALIRKRLLVADMESTVIQQEMIDELAEYVGRRAEIETITARAMRGELDFEAALKERVAMLAGLPSLVLDEVYQKRVSLMPGAETLIRTMKAHGAYCALVSGGFTVFTERVAKRLGFDEHQANVLEIEDGKLTGRVREPILGRVAKREALERIAARLGLHLSETLAVGDGANDLDMLAAAGLGVAFRAKPKVQEVARALPNGAVINHGDLTALLYLQGYCAREFVTAGASCT